MTIFFLLITQVLVQIATHGILMMEYTNTSTNPNHQYSLTGSFNVTLVATNSSGCNHDTTIGPIDVFPNPVLSASDTNLLCDSNAT